MPIVADAAVAIRGDLSKFNKDLKGTDKQVQTLGQRLNNALNPKNLAGGLAAGFLGSQVVSFLGDATSAAAEFQDSVSATGIIFGDELVGEMEAWAESAHASFGASKQDALAAANVMATLAKSAGLAGQDVVNFSQEMVQLGGDLASMFGGTTQDAITAVGAALRGESEPIRRYGVLLDDATLRQKAFEMGLISTTQNALTPQQRVLAAQAEILAQTSDAQGDFMRTSDGMANTQRELAAEFENIKIEIGEELLPVMLELATFVKDDVVPVLRNNLVPAIGFVIENGDKLIGLVTALLALKVVRTLTGWGDSLHLLSAKASAALGPLGAIVATAVALNEATGQTEPIERMQELATAMQAAGISSEEFNAAVGASGLNLNTFTTRMQELIDAGVPVEEAFRRAASGVDTLNESILTLPAGAHAAQHEVGEAFSGTGAIIETALADVPAAIGGSFEEGATQSVQSVRDMFVDIATVIAAREAELAASGGNAVDAWFEPMEVALKEGELTKLLEETNAELLEAEKNGTSAQVAEIRARRLGIVKELIELQIAKANIGTESERATQLSALRESDFMLQGLHSEDEGIRLAFRAWHTDMTVELDGMEADATASGVQTPDNLETGLRGGGPGVGKAAGVVAGYVTGALDLADDARTWGSNTANAFAAGLASGQGAVIYSANLLGYAAGRILGVQSEPDDPNSPLHGITKWGGNIAQTIADGILGELGAARFASNALATALVPSMAGGYGLDSASRLAGSVGEGGTTIQYILNVEGRPKTIGSRDDVLDAWEQEERF